jgi:geranylgeranyl diphosphate synthase type I
MSPLPARVASDPLPDGLASWRRQFQGHFEDALRELQGRFSARPGLVSTWSALHEFLSTEGKRVRPLLFLASHQLFSEPPAAPPSAAVYRVGCALELFHTFALVHDDIIDGSHSRRGQPTLHRRLSSGADTRSGENLALVLGDILFGFTVENFLLPGLNPARATAALRYFTSIAQDTGLGEALELALLRRPLDHVTEDDILNTYYLKTSRYTFEAPLLVGAILAGAPEPVLLSLHDFARPLGLAFQIENDLHEIGLLPTGATELAYDLRAGVKTLFLKRYHDALRPADAASLRACLAQDDPAELIARLSHGPTLTSVVADLKHETASHFQEARRILLAAPLRADQCSSLLNLAAFIHRNCHHSESPAASSAATARA